MSKVSIAERLFRIMPCEDDTCCCIPKRGTVICISVINLLGCALDLASNDTSSPVCCEMREVIDSVRKLLGTFFQMANIVLLLASVFFALRNLGRLGLCYWLQMMRILEQENALLVDVYVWYSLGYIVLGFMVAIYEFATRTKREGVRSLITFLPDVIFLFVTFRCLPLVDLYRKHLYSVASIASK